MDPIIVFVFVILFFLSSFFSGSEIALVSVSPHKVNSLIKEKKYGAKTLKKIKSNMDRLLITILFGNNVVNTFTAALATKIAINLTGNAGVGIATGIITVCLLVFGEILPKSIASKSAVKIALFIAPIYRWLMILLFPIIFVLEKVINLFSKPKQKKDIVTDDEIESIVDMGKESGGIGENEHERIKSILKFGDISVDEIMTPRVKLEVLDINITLEKAIKHYLTHTHSRIPVYEKTIDNIDYFIASRDLIREVNLGNLHKKLSDLKLRTVLKVPRNQSVSVLLDSLQKAHKTLAVVMDEYGGVAGLATMEDIMEVVFGEIRDETDDETEEFVKVGDDYISVESESLFEDLLGEFDLTLEDVGLNSVEFDGETISYVITKILNGFPTKGEKLAFNVNKEDKKGVLNIEVVDVMDAKIGKVNVKFTKTQEE